MKVVPCGTINFRVIHAPDDAAARFNALVRASVVTIGPLTRDEWIAGEIPVHHGATHGPDARKRLFARANFACFHRRKETRFYRARARVATALLHLVCAWHSCSLNALLSCYAEWRTRGERGGRGRWPAADDGTERAEHACENLNATTKAYLAESYCPTSLSERIDDKTRI